MATLVCSPPQAVELLESKPIVAVKVLLDGFSQAVRQLQPDQQKSCGRSVVRQSFSTESCRLLISRAESSYAHVLLFLNFSVSFLSGVSCQLQQQKLDGIGDKGLTGMFWASALWLSLTMDSIESLIDLVI